MALRDRQGQIKIAHEEKATILWEAFKERLGTKELSQMLSDLNELL
jgi:hypothetical protein